MFGFLNQRGAQLNPENDIELCRVRGIAGQGVVVSTLLLRVLL